MTFIDDIASRAPTHLSGITLKVSAKKAVVPSEDGSGFVLESPIVSFIGGLEVLDQNFDVLVNTGGKNIREILTAQERAQLIAILQRLVTLAEAKLI